MPRRRQAAPAMLLLLPSKHPRRRRNRLPIVLLGNLGGLRRHGSPLSVLLDEHIGPDVLPAAVLTLVHTLFGVASGHDGRTPEETHLHRTHFKAVQRIAGSLDVCQSRSLVDNLAVPLHPYPAI